MKKLKAWLASWLREPMIVRCGACHYWQWSKVGLSGTCHKSSPIIWHNAGAIEPASEWPITPINEWCGDAVRMPDKDILARKELIREANRPKEQTAM
jgi:hypothetical protein